MTNKERLQANNDSLREAISRAETLPDAGGVDVSGVTATPGTVMEGEMFVDKDGVLREGTMPLVSGEDLILDVENNYRVLDGAYYEDYHVKIILEEKSATPTREEQEVVATEGKVLSKVTMAPIPDEYVIPEGAVEITANGEHPVAGKAIAKVSVPIPDGYIKPSGEVEITENGVYDVRDKETADVHIPDPVVIGLNVTENGTYEPPDGMVGFNPVTVNVPIPDGYIKPSGSLTITENGTHDVTAVASVEVSVESSGGESPTALLDAALDGSLTSINSTVKSIVPYACRGLSKLKTVNLPDATSIGTYAFYYCTSMTNFSAPKVTSLGTYAFYNSGLKEVNFPLATSVTQNCFYSCNSLKKVDMGAAKSIAQSGFDYCESLETLILRRSDAICTLANATNTLRDTPIAEGTGYIYVPSALIETYKTATNWVNYASQFRAIEDYPDITGG